MKKILKNLTVLVLLIIISISLKSQIPNDGNNYFEIYNAMELYFNEKALELNIEYWEVEGHKDFQRWAFYFENKYDENGDFASYPDALESYYNTLSDFLPEDQPIWEYMSHDGIYNKLTGGYDCSVGQGNITSIWVDDSDPDYILGGGHYGSLWKTTNGGNDWECISNTEPLINGICSIIGDPTNQDKIYITSAPGRQNKGGGYSFGLFKTEDGGLTWENNKVYIPGFGNLYFHAHLKYRPVKWIINPLDANKMFLITWTQLLRSLDGGANWEVLLDKDGDYNIWGGRGFKDILFDPIDPSTLYVTGVEVHRLTNNGDDIEDLTDIITQYSTGANGFFQILVDAHPNYNDKIWFAVKTHDGGTDNLVYLDKTTNYVELLHTSTSMLDYYKMQCEISPTNPGHLLIGGGGALTKMFMEEMQPNPIKTISNCSPPGNWTHSDVRDANFIVDENGEEKIYVGNDGGVFTAKYNNAINDWDWDYIANDGTNGIRNSELHGFDCSNSSNDILYAGLQDMNSALEIENVWYNILGADGGPGLIDKTDPNYMYLSQWNSPAIFYKSNDGWQNPSYFFQTDNHSKPPIVMNLSNPNEIYIGDRYKVQKFPTIRDNNYHYPILTIAEDNYGPGELLVKEITISESNPDILFVSTDRYFGWSSNPPPTHEKSIYKIMDNGQTIIDLSENLINALIGGPITGIAINAFDENEIWTCFGTTAISTNANEKKKAYHSIDGGNTWVAMADGLPERIPANDIIYEKHTGILYLVNDVGIYYYDKGLGSWANITNNGPTSLVNSRFEFNYPLNKIRVGTFGRGIWQTDIPCFYNDQPLYVTTSQTWEGVKHIQSDVIVEAGVVLTITNSVYMPQDAKIIVKRNARLILDGGLITNACSGPWEGILVYGHSGQAQDYTYQGLVAVLNGGTIENAICGISTIKYSTPGNPEDDPTPDYYYTGGIVRCDDALFKNNQTAVKFWDYSFDESESFFRDCQFITDDQLLADIDPGYFIEMNDISGIKIQASTFTDTRTMANPIDLTSGIQAYDGHFEVFNSGAQNCVFAGLYYGIKAYAHGPGKFISIKNTSFDDNSRAVYISGMSNAEVTDNNFNINSPYSSFNGGYGLYLDHSTAYKVEDNNFYHEGAVLGVGLIVNQSGGKPNQIYRNYFTDLQCGMDIQGENRHESGSGLVLKCNQYENTFMDKIITWDIPISTPEAGIAESQGSPSSNLEDMAGNLFYVPGPSNDDYDDILNEGNHITYYYPEDSEADNVEPIDYTHNTISIVGMPFPFDDWTYEDGCPSSEEPGGGGGIGVIKGKMAVAENKADSTENILALLIDGGNTESTQTDVDNSIPPETMQVYNELMAKSPYLSDTVVSTAIEKEDVLPGAMLRDIMVANPNTAKSEKLMQKLDERWDPLPEYMKAQILAGRSIVSIREEAESRLASFKLERAKHFNALIRYYLNDTIDPAASMDSLVALLQNENSIAAKYSLAFMNGEIGEWNNGLIVLDEIPVQFELNAKQANTHTQMLAYYTILSDLAQEGKSVLQVDPAQIAKLQSIEATINGRVSAYPRNILLALGEIGYEEPIILPDMLKSSAAEAEYGEMLSKTAEAPNYIKVRPNPAKDYIILTYDLEKEGGATVDIHNINAKLKFTKNLTSKQDQFTIDTRGWKAGVYIITLKINAKLVESDKFTVID